MNRENIVTPVSPRLKRQTAMVLFFGLFLGGAMIFTAVYTGTKDHLRKAELERQKSSESVPVERPVTTANPAN